MKSNKGFKTTKKHIYSPLEDFHPCFKGDSDIIFADLDHDGDGKINFEDFSFGFRDFLTPGSRRGRGLEYRENLIRTFLVTRKSSAWPSPCS